MGLLDALSGAATTLTNGATAQQQGQLQGGQLAMMLQMRQAEMAKQRADTEQALAHAALFRHQNNQVLRGDLGQNGENLYANQLGTEKKTETEAETPALVDRTRQMLTTEDPFKRNFAQYQSDLEEQRQKNIEHLKAGLMDHFSPYQGYGPDGKPVMGAFNTKTGGFGQPSGLVGTQSVQQGEHLGNDFMRENQDLTKGVAPYMAVKVALAQAKAGNPAALKPALIDFASVADPKAQLRQGVMHEVMQVDPSVAGRWDLAVDKLSSGQLPPQVIANIEKMVDQLHQTHAATYEQRRSAFVKNAPMADQFIPKTQDVFSIPGVTPPSSTAPPSGNPVAGVAAKYGIKVTAP